MRRPAIVICAVVLVAVVALAVTAVARRTSLAFTLGVVSTAPVVTLAAHEEACQQPIDVPEGGRFDRVTFPVGTFHRPGSQLAVTVRSLGGDVLARGALGAGYPDITAQPVHSVRLDRSVGRSTVSVCISNRGRHKVALYGGADAAARDSTATVDGHVRPVDLDLDFDRSSRTLASLLPAMLRRAALFGFSWEGAWLYIVLGLALLISGPVLLARAVASADRADAMPTDESQ